MIDADAIIPAADLDLLVEAATLRDEAALIRREAIEDAVTLRERAKAEGHALGIADGCAAAAELLADARAEAQRRGAELEHTLAGLVAEAVRTILGEGDRDETVRAAVRTALTRLATEDSARLHIAPDMVNPVRQALDELGRDLPLVIDEDLPAGTALLSGSAGHAHIGLEAQAAACLEPFEAAK